MEKGFKLTEAQETAYKHIEQAKEIGIGHNRDYVSLSTYEKVFDKLGDLKGKYIIDAGAGLAPHEWGHEKLGTFILPIIEKKGAIIVPFDSAHGKTRTWNLYSNIDEKLKVAPVTGNVFEMPFKDESMDGCVSVNLINFPWSYYGRDNHEGTQRLLAEFARVLKKGGFVIISSFGYQKATFKDGVVVYNDKITPDQIVNPSEISHLATQAGFSEVSEIPVDEDRVARHYKDMEDFADPKIEKIEIIDPCAFLLKK